MPPDLRLENLPARLAVGQRRMSASQLSPEVRPIGVAQPTASPPVEDHHNVDDPSPACIELNACSAKLIFQQRKVKPENIEACQVAGC